MSRRGVGALGIVMLLAVPHAWARQAGDAPADGCDQVPTGVATRDHWLHFKLPAGLMPDPQFDGRPAKLEVHRVRPVYANGKCPWVPTEAAVLIHGRTIPGPPVFDLRDPSTGGIELSIQEALARAGIDTFAPSLLGFGRSTRFDQGLNDPANASLRPYLPDGTCSHPEGCDRTTVPWTLDQQRTMLGVNPLLGERRAHSSSYRFARVDVWVRDIRQVIDDAIERARPSDGRVTLVGYSAGGQRVGRALYEANPNRLLPGTSEYSAKVSRVVFVSSIFGGPTEETAPPGGFATFPLALDNASGPGAWAMPPGRDGTCSGHVIPGTPEQLWEQTMSLDPVGREWGGEDPTQPTGLNRSPTFSGYGWNATVAAQLTAPTLVIQGVEDIGVPGGSTTSSSIYNSLPSTMTNKVLVRVECASHALPFQGCAGPRCTPPSGTPYGEPPGESWAGPHATLKGALIEWIKRGTFDGATTGRFRVDASGIAAQVG